MVIIENLGLPKRPSDSVACAVGVSPVNEFGPLVESHVVSSNVNVSVLSEHVVLNPVDFEPCFALALSEEENLVHLVKLVEQNVVGFLLARLQTREQVQHKPSVVVVWVRKESWLVRAIDVVESKEPLEFLQEVFEQKLDVHGLLHLLWQLLENTEIVLLSKSYEFVVLEPVVEVRLDLLFQFDVNWLLSIELSDGP